MASSLRTHIVAVATLLGVCGSGAALAAAPRSDSPAHWYLEDRILRIFREVVYTRLEDAHVGHVFEDWPIEPLRLDPHSRVGAEGVHLSVRWRLETGPIVWPSRAEDLSDELLKSLERWIGDFPEKRHRRPERPTDDEE